MKEKVKNFCYPRSKLSYLDGTHFPSDASAPKICYGRLFLRHAKLQKTIRGQRLKNQAFPKIKSST